MTKIMIEFARPDGTILRNLDAGFDYIDDAQIPWSNAERRLRVTHSNRLLDEPIPLPDGLNSAVRVAAQVPLSNGSAMLKARVTVDGVVHELKLRVIAELVPLDAELAPVAAAVDIASPSPAPPLPAVNAQQPTDQEICPKCGRKLVKKQVSIGGDFVRFFACPDYPICLFTKDLPRP